MMPTPLMPPELAQRVLDALPTPVFFKDRAGIYTGCNEAFSQVLGTAPRELIGRSVFDLWPADLAQVYFDADEALMTTGGTQQYEAQVQLPSGERRDVLFYKAVLAADDGQVLGLAGTLLDITERKSLERRLTALADRDELTGLLNRRAIMAHLAQRQSDRRRARTPLVLLMCDVDHFKAINDQHGHPAGDDVLRMVAQRLQAGLREFDVIARVGGEEFLVVFHETDLDAAGLVAERLRRAVADDPFPLHDRSIRVTLSGGLATGEADDTGWLDVLRDADRALYVAKRAGRDRIVTAPAHTD